MTWTPPGEHSQLRSWARRTGSTEVFRNTVSGDVIYGSKKLKMWDWRDGSEHLLINLEHLSLNPITYIKSHVRPLQVCKLRIVGAETK